MLPCVLFEDEHLLVVNKPAGLNTHAPGPFAGEGLHDWLRHREPRWANLAIIHRLDKDTSGVMVFGKTAPANRSLTEQFTNRVVRKKYVLLTDRAPERREFTARSRIIRAGDRYVSSPHGEPAETKFQFTVAADTRKRMFISHLKSELPHVGSYNLVAAMPLTGRTHQVRVHAAESGIPVLGDTLYGGTPFPRVCLHAAELAFCHPATGEDVVFSAPVDFIADTRLALRAALVDPEETDAFRLIHGASDGWPGWYVDRLGGFLLSQGEREPDAAQRRHLQSLLTKPAPRASPVTHHASRLTSAYHKTLTGQVRRSSPAESSLQLILGKAAPGQFVIRENGLRFELSFKEGCSVGLFLDQRDNRRRLLTGHIAAEFALRVPDCQSPRPCNSQPATCNLQPGTRNLELLNCFAYTCGFSVCAAKAGARVTSLDLSRKYLEWGKRNFVLNGLDPARHDFIFGDAFDWLRRLGNKGRSFDVILLDPPTFSQSKERGVFRVEKDHGRLVAAALPLLGPDGILFASANAAGWPAEKFLASVEGAIRAARRTILERHYVPQPPDFPVSRAEPAYLKTVWLRLA